MMNTSMPSRCGRFAFSTILAGIALLAVAFGCRQEAESTSPDSPLRTSPPKPADLLIFPDELRVEDPDVNVFIERAMAACGAGDYDGFRGLWSAREEPMSREEYEQGWQAAREIRVKAMERVALARSESAHQSVEPEQVYVLLADVKLDPDHPAGQSEPHRQAVLMMVREHDAWRLAQAPKTMRDWIKKEQSSSDKPPSAP